MRCFFLVWARHDDPTAETKNYVLLGLQRFSMVYCSSSLFVKPAVASSNRTGESIEKRLVVK